MKLNHFVSHSTLHIAVSKSFVLTVHDNSFEPKHRRAMCQQLVARILFLCCFWLLGHHMQRLMNQILMNGREK